MKITHQPDTNWTKAVKCRTCTAGLEVDKADLTKHSDGRDQYYSYICPVCKQEGQVLYGEVPPHIRHLVKAAPSGWDPRDR